MPRHDRPSISQPPYRLADEVAAILSDLHAPGAVTALPDNGSEHILMFRPAAGVQLRRVCVLASDISRELDAAYVRIEPIDAAAELRIHLVHEVTCNG